MYLYDKVFAIELWKLTAVTVEEKKKSNTDMNARTLASTDYNYFAGYLKQ